MNPQIVSDIAAAMFKASISRTSNPSVEPREEHFVKKLLEYIQAPNHRFGIKKLANGKLVFWWQSEADLILACPIEDGFAFKQVGFILCDELRDLYGRLKSGSREDLLVETEIASWKALINQYDPKAEVYQHFH